MSKLKITDVQVDCRELTQEQIKEMANISGYKKSNLECYQHYNYFRIAFDTCNVGVYEESRTTITYDQFIKLFDKPKFKPKKAIKEREQRITLLEQKLSEKDAENVVNESVKELPIVIEKGMRFKHHITGGIYEIEGVSDEEVYIYTSNKQRTIDYEFNDVMDYFNKGIWIPLPPTWKKEIVPTKGSICKFWNDNDDKYEIGRYEKNVRRKGINSHNFIPHVNILTLESFKNAKVISIDEALQLFKKQLLNGN